MIARVRRLYREAYRGLPRELWLLAAATMIHRAGTMVLPFLSLYLTTQREFSIGVTGQIIGTYGLGSIIGSFVGGQLADRIGARRTMFLSLTISGVGYLILSQLDDLWAITIAVFFVSAVAEAFRPAVMACFARFAPEDATARSFALLRLAANIGVSIGPAVGGLIALYSYHWLFIVDAITCWVAAIVLHIFLAGPRVHAEDRAQPDPNSISPWTDGPFLALLLIVVGIASIFFQITSTFPLYLKEIRGFREDMIGAVFALNAVVIAIFEMLLMLWLNRFRKMRVIAFGAALICIGFGLMPFSGSRPYILFTVLVWTLGEMICLPYINALVAERAGRTHQGRYMGLYVSAFASAFVFAPIIGTQVYQRYGPDTLWFGIAVMALPLAVGSLLLERHLSVVPAAKRTDEVAR
ncbi:MAG: MFS transporter [Acidobacteriota bacterium]|nr:MFS transporter [Acidobacteriota bacterium]MDH3785432.1 MFS transporter [Acidobacteriota bacterium]